MFCEQYERYANYNVRASTQENTEGRLVCHTSGSNSGYFIPNGDDGNVGVCPCHFRKAFSLACRHDQAAQIANNEEPFCRLKIGSRHLFVHVLACAKKDMSIAQTYAQKDNDVLQQQTDMSKGK